MNVQKIPLKIKQRLQKLDSSDYTNLECWQFIEAYNKAQIEWVRTALDTRNPKREGAESSLKRMVDLDVLLESTDILGTNRKEYFESATLPTDYLQYRRLVVYGDKGDCVDQRLDCDLMEEGNVNDLLKDYNSKPSFEWRETFSTLIGNKLRVYTNNEFKVSKVELIYYRKPVEINLSNCPDITGQLGVNQDPELRDDVVELIIDDAAAILAGDIESINQIQILKNRSDKNN
jgi:hypothetical protein